MSINYTSFVSQLANMMPENSSMAEFQTFLGTCIDYSEGRLYRDLDLLSVRITDTSVNCTPGSRSIAQSTTQGYFLVIERVNIFSSAGTTSSNGTRNPVTQTSPDFIDITYPSALSSNSGLPEFWARTNDTTITFGPAPDQAYTTEIVGTIRPTPLSSGNSSTWLTQNVPELFMSAAMISAAAFMQNYGAQSDNPQMAQSWETTYQNLLKSALVDQLRSKFQSQAWTNQLPDPIASPPRV